MALDKIFQLTRGQLADLRRAIDNGLSSVVFYAAEYNRYHIASQLKRPFLYVAGDLVSARKAYEALSEYCDGKVALMPDREDVLISRKTASTALLYERVSVLNGLLTGEIAGAVVTAEGLMQYYPSPEKFAESVFSVKKDGATDIDALSFSLSNMGYARTPLVEKCGEFSVRGDIVDVFPLGESLPVRIETFGDTIESIKRFDPENMQYKGEEEEFTFLPATDILISPNEINGILNAIKKEAKNLSAEGNERLNTELERLNIRPSDPLNNFFIPYIEDKTTILGYLPSYGAVIFDDTKQIEDRIRLENNRTVARVNAMKANFQAFDSHKKSLATLAEIAGDAHVKLGFGRITSNVSMFEPKQVFAIKANALPAFYNDMPAFFEQIRQLTAMGADIVVVCKDENALAAMKAGFADEFIGCSEDAKSGVRLTIGRISKGFIYPAEKLVLIGINDVARKAETVRGAKAKRVVFEIPEKGDYVVHDKHGIGISEGIQKVSTPSGEKDYYVVLYRDGDRLYLPCDQLDTLEKYNGGDKPSLHKLGGAEFERVKKRVKESIKKMAIDLLSLYQARFGRKGHVYQPDTVWQKEMEDDFPYVETDDQLAAIAEIKKDMESGKVMDRLLCGDVGYGKTEVAMRAIFKTIVEGKQAAILAPTTILAQQHYNLLRARFNKFGIKIDMLSRFVPSAEIKKSLERIKDGATSVVVATHRILGKDVIFNDLGLLVLDEEQRFGVEHKEKLKVYRENVNILSLSATPIPRTLHMALSGIRDISTLETPPNNRLPVETYVTEYNDNLLIDAVRKEIARDGQVFLLYNRVQSIENFYRHVTELLPEVSVIYAHGQLDEDVLEDRIREFYENRAQVLISTTIIENGIDLPNANTLFVIEADKLGLSQLYQLRGRVGRSNVPAYAYFTVPEGRVLTTNATQRLEALMDNTDLGSGFRIAMRDLEIRGAGNLLGREQHGQMERVGYEMYLKLIKEGVQEAQGVETAEEREVEIKIDADYALDEKYIPDSKGRVTFYKKVSALTSREEGQYYYDYLKKNYGKPPECVRTIIRVGIIKNLAKTLKIAKVTVSKKGTGLEFTDSSCLGNARLFEAIDKYKKYAVLSPADPPVIVFDAKAASVINAVKMILDFLITAAG